MRAPSLRSFMVGTAVLATLGLAAPAQATPLTLTQAGINLGFTLQTVVSQISGPGGTGNCCYVLGSAINSAGHIILNNGNSGRNYEFNNVNNQVGTAAALNPAGVADGYFPVAMANANGNVYASGGTLRRLNNDGSTAQTYAINSTYGLWTNPVNQHLISVGGNGLLDIDVSNPNAPLVRVINNAFSDGITVSPDGLIVYTNTCAYRISDGVQLGCYSVSGADGMGVIVSSNSLNGKVIVSTASNGTLVMLDPSNAFAQTVIATGGGYGDFTSPDFTTGTLLISSGDSLLRLGCGEGCGVGSAPVNGVVPEPGSLLLLGTGALGLVALRRRQTR